MAAKMKMTTGIPVALDLLRGQADRLGLESISDDIGYYLNVLAGAVGEGPTFFGKYGEAGQMTINFEPHFKAAEAAKDRDGWYSALDRYLAALRAAYGDREWLTELVTALGDLK